MNDSDVLWTTREGLELRIGDMTDRHLVNAIRFLARRADGFQFEETGDALSAMSFLQGEMALMYAEADTMSAMDEDPVEFRYRRDEQFRAMVRVASSRGILEDEFRFLVDDALQPEEDILRDMGLRWI